MKKLLLGLLLISLTANGEGLSIKERVARNRRDIDRLKSEFAINHKKLDSIDETLKKIALEVNRANQVRPVENRGVTVKSKNSNEIIMTAPLNEVIENGRIKNSFKTTFETISRNVRGNNAEVKLVGYYENGFERDEFTREIKNFVKELRLNGVQEEKIIAGLKKGNKKYLEITITKK